MFPTLYSGWSWSTPCEMSKGPWPIECACSIWASSDPCTHRFISKQYIYIGQDLQHGLFEELAQKWCRQVHSECFVLLKGVFGQPQYWWGAHSQWKTLKSKWALKDEVNITRKTTSDFHYLFVWCEKYYVPWYNLEIGYILNPFSTETLLLVGNWSPITDTLYYS